MKNNFAGQELTRTIIETYQQGFGLGYTALLCGCSNQTARGVLKIHGER